MAADARIRKAPKRFILASSSPRRRQMLAEMGVDFEIVIPDIAEDALDGESPIKHTRRLAEAKARVVAEVNQNALVLGVDTTVFIDGLILGKPANRNEAREMLARLAGRTHTVVTAYALLAPDFGVRRVRHVASRVEIRALEPARIAWYVTTGEPMDKAGAYAIQGVGAALVRRVRGSYSCVVGLPLCEMVEDVERLFGPNWLFESRDVSAKKERGRL